MEDRAATSRPAPDHRRWIIVAVGVTLVLAVALYWQFGPYRDGAFPAASNQPMHDGERGEADLPGGSTVDVQVTQPVRRPLLYRITLPANIAPLYQTTLYAKVSGYLKWIGPDKGDVVKAQEVLAVIDAPEVEEQYHQAVADYKIKKLTYERMAKVWKESPDVIAKQDVDVAEAAYQGAKHSMEQREALRAYTKVRAPYHGIVTARFADPGALIQVATTSATGAIPLFTIMDDHIVRVYTNVPQDEAAWIVPGKTKVAVVMTEPAGRRLEGTVTRSTLALDPSTRSLLVEIDLPNPDRLLRPGTFVEAELVLREIADALVLPPQAIISGPKGQAVFIVEHGRAKMIPIQTGITDGRWIEVTKGLSGQEEVVVVGKRKLLDDMPVQAEPFHLPDAKPASQKFERRSPGDALQPGPNGPSPSTGNHGPAVPNRSGRR